MNANDTTGYAAEWELVKPRQPILREAQAMIGRSQGHLAAMAGVLVFGACSDPDEHSDLRPSGPPEVLTVLAANDVLGRNITEHATFCKVGDDKRPALVPSVPMPVGPQQICPEDP